MPTDAPGPSGQSLPPPPLSLLVLRGPAAGRTLTAGPTKAASASLSLGRKPSRDIHVPDDGVSEHHALLEWEARPLKKRPARALSAAEAAGGAWTLRDVGSTNGTRHNGEDVVREGAAHDLEDGDVVWLGRHTVAVVQIPTPIRHALTVAETADAEAARLIKHAHAVADAAVAGLHEEVAGLAKAPAGGLCVAVGKATAA